MGDPKKIRRKYDTPSHPWQRARIDEEKKVIAEFGLKTKKEIWKLESLLRSFKNQAKSLASRSDAQSKKEEKQLVDRLISMGLLHHGDSLGKVLSLTLNDVMARRLQTFIFKKGLARTMTQARQFITHGHILVNKKKITFPSYLVNLKDEATVEFMAKSGLAKDDHPERVPVERENKGKQDTKKKHKQVEDLPAFSQKEIEKIEETGSVEPLAEIAE